MSILLNLKDFSFLQHSIQYPTKLVYTFYEYSCVFLTNYSVLINQYCQFMYLIIRTLTLHELNNKEYPQPIKIRVLVNTIKHRGYMLIL